MAGKSDAFADLVLDLLVSGTTINPGTWTPHVALFTTSPTDAGGGTEVDHSTVRQNLDTAGYTTITDESGSGAGRETSNNAAISWSNWDGTSPSTILSAGIYTASTAGTFLYWNTLTASRVINTGETATFAANALVIVEN